MLSYAAFPLGRAYSSLGIFLVLHFEAFAAYVVILDLIKLNVCWVFHAFSGRCAFKIHFDQDYCENILTPKESFQNL